MRILLLPLLVACGAGWSQRDEDGDGYSILDGDCWDTEPTVSPAGVEACDGIDQDCDGVVDDGVGQTFYVDADGDGFGNLAAPVEACAPPPGAVADATDCDDAGADVHPGAEELCDDLDSDCDGDLDDGVGGAGDWYVDADADGYGSDAEVVRACEAPDGFVGIGGDCDDGDPAFHPDAVEDDCTDPADYNCDGSSAYDDLDADGWIACEECDDGDAEVRPDADEVCNTRDDDCDGAIDDDAIDAGTWHPDADGDGFGDLGESLAACAEPEGYVVEATDCDDTSAYVNPAATESCNGGDDDCDGTIDEDAAVDAGTWYEDGDGDGYGDPGAASVACVAPDGTVADATDCDDGAAAANPGADELCDGLDNDCDGAEDEVAAEDALPWYADSDGDGYGDPGEAVYACDPPSGYVASATDCDDAVAAAHPGAAELCDDRDNDCDGTVDEAAATDAVTWHADADADGYGSVTVTTRACDAPAGYVADATDCDDAAATAHPGGTEVCDSRDNDCDGTSDEASATDARTWYADADADGYGSATTSTRACTAPVGYLATGTDCNDAAAAARPGGTEICDDLDNDCDGVTDESGTSGAPTWYEDADGDGYGQPGASIRACDLPAGYAASATDCDDDEAASNPGATEICDDLDNDCDGSVDSTFFSESFGSSVSASVLDLNGDAWLDTAADLLVLADAADHEAGSAVVVQRVPADRWYATFRFEISGGDGTAGGEGLTFFFLDETSTFVLGDDGQHMGISSAADYGGYAIQIDTYDNGGSDPTADHVALMDVAAWTHLDSATIGEMQSSGSHTLAVEMDAGFVEVWLDGALVLDTVIAGYTYDDLLLGWSAGTSTRNNRHTVDDAAITCP